MYKTLATLTLAQAFAQTGAPIVVLLGGIVGTRIAPSADLATLPVALMIVGTASTTIPAALLMKRIGRKRAFLFAAFYCMLAGLLAAFAITRDDFALFCVATFMVGSHNAFVQQYRFAVAESVPEGRIGPSLSILMLAGVAAAFMGPEIAQRFAHTLPAGEFVGSYLGLSACMTVTFCVLLFYRNTDPQSVAAGPPPRPLGEIFAQPRFMVALGAAVVAWSVMSLIMTATPVSMHEIDRFDMNDTAWVIQSHIIAMYLPSVMSGFLVARFGSLNIIRAGLVLLFACLAVAWVDRHLMHYWWALVLLGVGWNFLFLGGTTLLTSSYRQSERFKVQAVNDFVVFSMQGLAALSSGMILLDFGWHYLLLVSLPLLLALMPAVIRGRLLADG